MSLSIDELLALPAIPFLGLAQLMRFNFRNADMLPLHQRLIDQAVANPDDAGALLDASVLLQFYDKPALALLLQREALSTRRHYAFPARQTPRLRLLALMAPGGLMANQPVECLLENSDVELDLYYASAGRFIPDEIPPHDVLLVAMSETDDNGPLLDFWQPILAQWPRPVLNCPANIQRVARDAAAALLSTLPGVMVPLTYRVGRQQLVAVRDAQAVLPIDFPVLVRPVNSHAGNDFYKLDSREALGTVLTQIPGDELFVSGFVDYRSADGQFRKYRVILIDGCPYACHMGISDHWMIHYLNAGMADSAEKRAEEARFMATFDADFAVRHAAALAGIHARIGLDYLGIDCAETPDGRLLVFEIDHAMVVHAMDPVALYPYKQPAMQKLFGAFRAMLIKAADRGAAPPVGDRPAQTSSGADAS